MADTRSQTILAGYVAGEYKEQIRRISKALKGVVFAISVAFFWRWWFSAIYWIYAINKKSIILWEKRVLTFVSTRLFYFWKI